MKTEFKAKFLQHINKRRQDQGFTLIELLVVIIIIGILSAIALPSFLSQANKAKQSEAKQYLSSINKGQQAFYAENPSFASDVAQLGLGLKTETSNYIYTIGASSADGVTSAGSPKGGALKGYAGGVALIQAGEAKTTASLLCETTGVGAPTAPTLNANPPNCGGAGMSEVTK